MLRIFETNYVRKTASLNGLWDFVADDGTQALMPVPGCWENNPQLATYRGKGTYTKEINLAENSDLRLVFKGVSHTADV